jgi:hypothetical protein
MPEVRRAELVEEPEVRRAESAPPEEGPDEAARDTTSSPDPQTNPVTQSSGNVADTVEPISPKVKRTDPEPKAIKPRPKKTERIVTTRRRVETRTYPPQPVASMRARFVGVTEDGRWMFVLPSNKVIIVPPPPGYP